ncbi:PilW family protein [Colwellia sp. 1_MG-2023]|uniref:PilW family protein n=1 Tax=Colwellia sp. 1_MG-2023 TaxID=3062649 RepID=UPI0026E396B7|nr:PilW family protein [Colwellia sp. 1_MG-2023]MDO6445833.1 PilW family protein [Colwellia sp. 1_MG-2023]
MKNFNYSYHKGFSLIELFISLAVGLGLLAGVLSVFVSMKTTTKETSTYGELQENGRFALNVLSDDLLRQDFWGDYVGTFDLANLNGVALGAPGNDCQGGGINNTTFPAANGHFRTLWGETAASGDPLGCFATSAQAKTGSDILQLKRVISTPVLPADISADNYYLITNINDGELFDGGAAVPTVDNSQIWEYQHHVYYVTEQVQGTISVPVLMKGRLTNSMSFSPIIDGIEMIRFMYGVDTTDDGIVNAFISADNMTEDLWNNATNSNILAVKIFVLARSVLPDNKYTNNNTYQLGDLSFTPNDNFRRLLFSSTVTLFNARVDSWQ